MPSDDPQVQSAESKTPHSNGWVAIVAFMKDAKDVLAAIAAIGASVAFAFNYFATARALECFKAETRNSSELVQTILQINTLTAAWESTTVQIRKLEAKSKDPAIQLGSEQQELLLKESASTQAQSDSITSELKAARERKRDLERSRPPCE